jgi:class 3 adenylate cyclase
VDTEPPGVGAVQSMLPLKTLPYVERGRNFCERFESVTILFSDIVSFTNLAAEMDPLGVVNMLNELYRMYDGLVDKYHVYKVRRVVVGERGADIPFTLEPNKYRT